MENSAHGYSEGSEPTLKEEIERLESENERLRQAYKYIHASRNNVDEELNNLQKELASLKEVVKDLLPLAQEVFDSITIDDAETHREYISLKALLDRAKTLLR